MSTPDISQRATSTASKKAAIKPIQLESGKLPPQAIELEEAVLGAMMLEKDALSVVIDLLKPDAFYVESNKKIFESIRRLFNKSLPVDILTVCQELRLTGELDVVGGPSYVASLTTRVGSAANIETHARMVSEQFIKRELIRISGEIQRDSFTETVDVFDLLDRAESALFSVAEGNIKRGSDDMSTLIAKAIKQLQETKSRGDGLSGVPSGFIDLDRMTAGWQKAALMVLAARPGMGKTAFVLALARNAAVDHKIPVAVFSLEMSSVELVNRLISSESELPADLLKKGNLADYQWEQLNHKVTKLAEAPIFIDDTPSISLFELRARCRRLKAQHDIQMIIIDYLQLMSGNPDQGKSTNREQEIATISRGLKALAKELEVPVIALSQLSRAVESRGGDKRPQLSDLRESGAIEQDADMVMFIYRPEYYNITEDAEGNSTAGRATIIIAKHRNGGLGDVHLRFIDKFAKFTNADLQHRQSYGESQNEFVIKQSKINNSPETDVPF